MSKLNCLIIEDEPLARKILERYIAKVPFLHLQACFEDAIYAMSYLNENSTDLIFLDIHLPEMEGLEFLRTLTKPPSVIITSAYHQYALEGFELNVADYLLKPFEFSRFLTAVNKVANQLNAKQEKVEMAKDYILVTIQLKKLKIFHSEILYIESQKEYIKIVTLSGNHIARMSTHEIESLLPEHLFRKVHRSYIVSLQKIRSFTAEIVEIAGIEIPVSRSYRDVLDLL